MVPGNSTGGKACMHYFLIDGHKFSNAYAPAYFEALERRGKGQGWGKYELALGSAYSNREYIMEGNTDMKCIFMDTKL